MKYLFIDIRKSDEVYSKRFDSSELYSVYNIPMNMIRFNKEMIINHLQYVNEIYIVCASSSRAGFIKDKYFSNHENIKVSESLQFNNLNHGMNKIILSNHNININIVGSNSFNLYSIMRIIQLIMGTMILLIGTYTYNSIKTIKSINKVPLIILILFGIMAIINGLTSTCTLSRILVNELN